MIDLDNQTDFQISLEPLQKILSFVTKEPKHVELIVTDSDSIRQINREYRSIDKATDVLSFPYEQLGFHDEVLGSIIICIDFIQAGAATFHHTEEDELKLLFIHGLLHILGYDHEVDNGEMREKEQEVIEHFNLPSSLIIRTNKE